MSPTSMNCGSDASRDCPVVGDAGFRDLRRFHNSGVGYDRAV